MLKPGVRLLGVRPELVVAMMAAKSVWEKYGATFVITSVIDGVHSHSSEHYSGCAFDARIATLRNQVAAVAELNTALGVDFDVILEKDHVHVEFQPKGSY